MCTYPHANTYMFACGYVHICCFCWESSLCQGSALFTPHLRSGVQTTAESHGEASGQTSSLFFSLPDDFANGSDCLCQSVPRQASSSSNHHSNAFLPLMTHWAWLHNSRRHIKSTSMCICLCGVLHLSCTLQTSILQLYSTCSSEKIMDSCILKQTLQVLPPHSSFVITELAVQPFSPSTVILLSSLQCSL